MDYEQQLGPKISEFIRQRHIAHEKFTEEQLAKVIKEALIAGDFVSYVARDGGEKIYYVPYAELDQVKARLLVMSKLVSEKLIFQCDRCGRQGADVLLYGNVMESSQKEGDPCQQNVPLYGTKICDGKMRWALREKKPEVPDA